MYIKNIVKIVMYIYIYDVQRYPCVCVDGCMGVCCPYLVQIGHNMWQVVPKSGSRVSCPAIEA